MEDLYDNEIVLTVASTLVNLVKDELYDAFIADAKKKYAEKFGKELKVIDVVIGDGSRKIC